MKRFLIFFLLPACGYHLVGTQSSLPPEIQRVYIPVFENQSQQPEIEQRLTQWVAEEFVNRGKLTVVGTQKEADALLLGEIRSFTLTPMALDEEGRATDYLINFTMAVKLVKNDKEKTILWQNPGFVYRERYTIGTSPEDYFDRLYQAVDEMGQRMAQSLVIQVLEGF